MTEPEPTVPVPVSLLERLELAADVSNFRDPDAAREARALLSQPTPPAEPLRIEDMEPGTTDIYQPDTHAIADSDLEDDRG